MKRLRKALKEGDKVRVHYRLMEPIEGVVVEPEDPYGWVVVEEDFMGGKNRFVALPEFCERI